MNEVPRISEAEWEVMKVIWKRSPCGAQDVIQALAATATWEPATIKTLLNRLIRKGALRFEKAGKSYVYFPVFLEDQLRGAEADSFLHRVFDGVLSPMISHFVKSRRLSAEELDALEKMLRDRRKKR